MGHEEKLPPTVSWSWTYVWKDKIEKQQILEQAHHDLVKFRCTGLTCNFLWCLHLTDTWLYMHTGAIHTYIQGSCPQLWRDLNSSNARGSKDVEETEACVGLKGWVLSRKMFQFHDFSHCRRTKNLQERFLSWCGAASKLWHAMTAMQCWVDVLGPPLVDLRTFKAGKCRKTLHKAHLVTSSLLWFWFPAESLCQFLKFFVCLPEGLSVQEKPRLVWVWDGSLGLGWWYIAKVKPWIGIPKTWTKSKDRTRLDSDVCCKSPEAKMLWNIDLGAI